MYRFQCSFQIFPTSIPYNVQNMTERDILEKLKNGGDKMLSQALLSFVSPFLYCKEMTWEWGRDKEEPVESKEDKGMS